MAVDTAAKAAAKWSELSRAESGTIDKVLKGTATKADTDRLLKLINQYSKLAGDVFQRGVGMIETAADKRIAAEVKKRSKGGELTDAETEQLVKEVTATVYQERSADLLQAIEELVDSANESMSQFSEEQYDDAVGQAKSQYDELIQRLQGKVKDKNSTEQKPGVKTVEDVLREVEESNGGGSDSGETSLEDALATPDSPRGKQAEAARRQEDRESTENWATAWWRKFSEYGGSLTGKAKDAGKSLLGELASLGGLAYIFSPTFRKWIDDKLAEVGNFFTMDNVKKLLGEAWEFVKKEADDFANHLKEMMGFTDADPIQQAKDRTAAESKNRKAAEDATARAEELKKEADELDATEAGQQWFPNATQAAAQEKRIEAKQQEAKAKRSERLAEKLKRSSEQAAKDELTLSGGGGGGGGSSSSSSTAPASTTETSATPPSASATAASMPGANIETAAQPPVPEGAATSGSSADGKAVVPPAGGGSQEGYVPSAGNALLTLSNMFG